MSQNNFFFFKADILITTTGKTRKMNENEKELFLILYKVEQELYYYTELY